MQNNKLSVIEEVIASVDNDFNIDNTDWIPRVGAWCIAAMEELKVLPYVRKRERVKVVNHEALIPCSSDFKDVRVYDLNGCEIPRYKTGIQCCGKSQSTFGSTPVKGVREEYYLTRRDDDVNKRYVHINPIVSGGKQYILQPNNKIELNFDTDQVDIEFNTVSTYWSEFYSQELPHVPKNGKLKEGLRMYVMFKILSRGGNHPVWSLKAQLPTNPYLQWVNAKQSIQVSIILDQQDENSITDEGWGNYFSTFTFD